MTKKFEKWPHALEYYDRAEFLLLGNDCPYTGEVIWKKKGTELVFGNWIKGNFSQIYHEQNA